MLQEIWSFTKNPIYEDDENIDINYRLRILFRLLLIALAISIVLGGIIGLIKTSFNLDFGEHAIEEALEKFPLWFLAFATIVLAPLIEEFIFRGPMIFFKDKPYFKYVFYGLTLIFAFYHITNFEISTTVLLLSPVLVAPQISVGVLLGFIRVRFGLVWAIALHAAYNLLLVGPIITVQMLDIPLE